MAEMFNYHLLKLQEEGTLDRLRQEIERKHERNSDASQIQNVAGLSFENVAFPFLALMTGTFLALVQFGIEVTVFFKNKCADGEKHSYEDNSACKEANDIIMEIDDLLLDRHSRLKDIQLLLKIRTLALSD